MALETTANASAFTFYALSQHPHIEQKVISELDSVLNGEAPTFESINQLIYLDLVVKESLRMYPPASTLAGRICIEDDTLPGNIKIEKGTDLEIWPYVMHHSNLYWDDPHLFIPERFNRGEPKHKYAYLPFSLGPRSCIGNRLAELEVKVIVAMVLQRYHLQLKPDAKFHTSLLITLRPEDQRMTLHKR